MVRRISILVVSLALLWTPIGQGRAAAAAPLYFGAYPGQRAGQSQQQATQALEAQIGRKLAVIREYDLWDSPFPTSYDNWLRDTGHILALSVKAMRMNKTRIKWLDIANAQPGSGLYTDMMDWVTSIRDFDGPVWFIFNHEQEAASNDSNGTASDFIAAWRKFITLFRQQGLTNVKYVWTATDYAFWRTDGRRAALWYPGDAYVDAIAADAYNWYNCRPGINNPWWSLQQVTDPLRQFGQAHPDKELMLMEFGSFEDPATPGRKASWFSAAQQLFKQPGWEQFTAILYFNTVQNSYPDCLWWIDTSQSSLNAFKTFVNDPFYGRLPGQSDTTPPSVPGQATGASTSPGSIDLSWQASTDDVAQTLTYEIFRDGGSNPAGSVTSTSATTVGFTDTGLVAGTTHTYEITASDGVNTSARSAASLPITVLAQTTIFSDGFTSGFSNWTGVTGLTVDSANGNPAPPSARAQAVSSRAWAYRTLSATYPAACLSERVNLASIGANTVDLMRLRTASDGPIARIYVASDRTLFIRSDFSGSQLSSGVRLSLGTWNLVELCGTVGAAGAWTMYLNGTQIAGPWTANSGTTSIGRVQIGDTALKTFTANVDDVVLDTQPG